MKSLLDNHPLVGIELDVVSYVPMVTLNTSIDVDPKTEKSTFTSQWIEKLFGGKAAYVKNGTNEYLETIQEQQQQNDSIKKLADTKSRTNDTQEYQDYSNVFKQVSPAMVKQSYSQETLDSKSRKDGKKQSYYRSIANRILSQCHAIAPEKKGAPIVIIGKPTFSATSSCLFKRDD